MARLACSLLMFALAVSCSHGSQPAAVPQATAAAQPVAPAPQASPVPAGAESAPPPVDEASPCQSDGDCALTRVGTTSCCESLCQGRPVTKARAEELARKREACQGCPVPLCRESKFTLTPACVASRCTVKRARVEE
jgi:hypothetical protein